VKRKIFYLILFILTFLVGILLAFPVKTLALRLLTENNIQFKGISGNNLKLKIEGIKKNDIYIPNLTVENRYFYQKVILDKNNHILIKPLSREINLKLKNFVSEKYILKENVKFNIKDTDVGLFLFDSNILMNGNGKIDLKSIEGFELNNMKIDFKLKENREEKSSFIEANINSDMIKGTFTGNIYIDIKNKEKLVYKR